MLRALAALGSLGGPLVTLGCSGSNAAHAAASPSATDGRGMMTGGGMMGAATTADMSSYMDMFDQHTNIRRTVEQIPGGVAPPPNRTIPRWLAGSRAMCGPCTST